MYPALEYMVQRYKVDLDQKRMPIEVPKIGRHSLADMLKDLQFNTGVEIGVEEGAYSEALCRKNPNLKLWCVDPWKAYGGYRDHVSQSKLEAFYNFTVERMKKYNCEIIRKFSMEAVQDFANDSLDFVYIDGNHNFLNVTRDIHEWSKKVKLGGIISGHDYVRHRRPTEIHVVQVVNGYTDAYEITPWFILGTKEIIDGITMDRPRSFMWIKQPYVKPRKDQQ
jgi:hypothetical protein